MFKINKEKFQAYWQRRRYRYTIYISIGLAVFFLASSVIAITLYTVLPDSAIYLLPDVHRATEEERVLVLSPHPDDETIAVGGYNYEAVKAGAEVRIVLVTDGDKHGWQDIRFKEFQNSASVLGIPESNLEYWNFKEGMTNEDALEAIKSMIITEIRTYQPTIVIAPLVQDNHFDHHLVGKAYLEAAQETNYQSYSYGYLVHHRFFPQPKKYAPNRNMMPPIKYLNLGFGWAKDILSPEAVDAKNEAVLGYHSQLRIPLLNSLLKSMIRQNEVFLKLN